MTEFDLFVEEREFVIDLCLLSFHADVLSCVVAAEQKGSSVDKQIFL